MVGKFDANSEDLEDIRRTIRGTEAAISDLTSLANMEKLMKHHGITDKERSTVSTIDCITARIGLNGSVKNI